jgi:hypothetical protein
MNGDGLRARLDPAALRAGASVALVFAVPFSVLARWMADRDGSAGSSSAAAWLSLLALVGFVLGAGVAAWLQDRRLPLVHGIVCATGTYVAAQTVFVVVKLARGGSVSWLGVFFNLTAVVFAGLVGGTLGNALQRRGLAPRSVPRSTDTAEGSDR